MKPRFEIRKSPVDGMLRVWEQRMASDILDPWGFPAFELDPMGDNSSFENLKFKNYHVWVCTGVYRTRREVFKDRRTS